MQMVIELIIEFIGHATARIVLPIFTLGWMRAAPLSHQLTPEPFLLRRDSDGAFVVDWFVATLVGVVFWTVTLLLVTRFATRWGFSP